MVVGVKFLLILDIQKYLSILGPMLPPMESFDALRSIGETLVDVIIEVPD